LLTLTLFIIYSIYFDTVTLCDDNGFLLYEFKTHLTSEVARYRTAIINYECYSDLREQLTNISTPRFIDFNKEQALDSQIRVSQLHMRESLTKIRQIESNIRIIEPGFKSAINYSSMDYINFFRVGRG
jgi:hypothetical protein